MGLRVEVCPLYNEMHRTVVAYTKVVAAVMWRAMLGVICEDMVV